MEAAVIDVVCGMTIDPQTAAGESSYQGKVFYFCSAECKREFDGNPEKYKSLETKEDPKNLVREPRFTKTGPIVAPMFGAAGSGGLEYEPLPGDEPDTP